MCHCTHRVLCATHTHTHKTHTYTSSNNYSFPTQAAEKHCACFVFWLPLLCVTLRETTAAAAPSSRRTNVHTHTFTRFVQCERNGHNTPIFFSYMGSHDCKPIRIIHSRTHTHTSDVLHAHTTNEERRRERENDTGHLTHSHDALRLRCGKLMAARSELSECTAPRVHVVKVNGMSHKKSLCCYVAHCRNVKARWPCNVYRYWLEWDIKSGVHARASTVSSVGERACHIKSYTGRRARAPRTLSVRCSELLMLPEMRTDSQTLGRGARACDGSLWAYASE